MLFSVSNIALFDSYPTEQRLFCSFYEVHCKGNLLYMLLYVHVQLFFV